MSDEMVIVSSSEEDEEQLGTEMDIPSPINSFHFTTYNHTTAYNTSNMMEDTMRYDNGKNKAGMVVRYKECLKNHAASIGGHVIDGCGEFLPIAGDGIGSSSSSSNNNGGGDVSGGFTCSACKCHRSFHRKVIESRNDQFILPYHPPPHLHHNNTSTTTPALAYYTTTAATPVPCKTLKSGSASQPSQCNEQPLGYHSQPSQRLESISGDQQVSRKKRFRTIFSQEQKEKMAAFAEKIGWRLQRDDESAVQEFCAELGVKRKVFKVWMHNNKHKSAKNLININY